MITIFHNNRCSKSRAGLEILEQSGKEYQIRYYLEEAPTPEELEQILSLLKIKPLDLVRKNEPLWKEKYQGKKIYGKRLLQILSKNPQLIERPIVINDGKAVVGRPPGKILEII